MAKDNKIRTVEEIEKGNMSELDVNAYTVQYDSKVKRFFKGFAPKVASGGLISTAIFAGLSLATVLTGGIAGLGIGALVGASVATGAAIQTIYSGVVYSRNASNSRFKALGVGGFKDEIGAIGVVEEYEKRANKYTQLLEDLSSQNTFTLEDGATYSRRDLQRRIKESEDIAYHGLKYILNQGIQASENINALRKKTNLTKTEEEKLEQYWDMMSRISACVENIATGRRDFNPYKALIADAILKGCLLGNDYQNNNIRAVKSSKDKNEAYKVYSNMYEQKILKEIQKERREVLEQQKLIQEDQEMVIQTRGELIAQDRDIAKVKRANRKLAKQMNELDSYNLLLDVAGRLAVSLPQDLAEDRKAIVEAREEFKTAIESKEANEIKTKKDDLDILVNDTQDKLYAWYSLTGKKAGLEKFEKQFEEYKAVSEQAIARQTQKFESSVQRAWNQRAKNKALTKKLGETQTDLSKAQADLSETQTDLDIAMEGWYDAEGKTAAARRQTKRVRTDLQKAKELTARQRSTIKQQQSQIGDQQAQIGRLEDERNSIAKQSKEANKRLNLTEMELDFTNQALGEAKEQAKISQKQEKKVRKQATKAIELAQHFRQDAQTAKKQAIKAKEQVEDVIEEREFVRVRAENAEETVKALYDNFTQAEQDLKSAQTDLSEAEKRAENAESDKAQILADQKVKDKKTGRKIATLLAKMITSNKEQKAEIGRLEEERDDARDVAYQTYTEKVALAKKKQVVEAENADLANKNAVANLKLGKAKKANAGLQDKIDSQNQQIGELEEHIQVLNDAQGENIETIIGLQVDKENLEKNLADSRRATKEALDKVANANEANAKHQAEIDKQRKEIAKREKERDKALKDAEVARAEKDTLEMKRKSLENDLAEAIETARQQNEQVEYVQDIAYQEHDGRQIAEGELYKYTHVRDLERERKALRLKVKDVWNHMKITNAENHNAYAESLNRVREKLEGATMLKDTSNNIEDIKKARKELTKVYEEESKKKDAEWPKYQKDKTKKEIIQGTPIPPSPDDRFYY